MADTKVDPKVGAKLTLRQKLDMLSLIALAFVDLVKMKDKDGNMIAVLQLAEPIPIVRGSQEVELNGVKYPVTAKDVKEIKIHESDFNDDFQFDAKTNTGSYEGSSLIMDVSKTGQVWLRTTSFAQSGNEYRSKAANDRISKLLGVPVAGSVPAPGTKLEPTQ